MTFPLAFACTLLLIAAFIGCVKCIAEAGDKRAVADRNFKRDATPPHEYTNFDGTKGRWP